MTSAQQIANLFLQKGAVDIPGAIAAGMVPKEDLIHGARYRGHCRNASEATWDSVRNAFVYLRTKFGEAFYEEIEHPEDDRGYDVFVPVERLILDEQHGQTP